MDVSGGQALARLRGAGAAFIVSLILLSVLSNGTGQAAERPLPGDYLPAYRAAAERGDPKSQFYLGLRYEEGVSAAPDYETAAHWYGKAAAQGVRQAAFRLGVLYQEGRIGGAPAPGHAARWYREAAEAGLPEAQFNLAYLYERGLGIDADGAQAAVWYRRAALQGMTSAYKALGVLFAAGRLVERDDAKALFWLSLLENESRGDVEAIRSLIRGRNDAEINREVERLRAEWHAQK